MPKVDMIKKLTICFTIVLVRSAPVTSNSNSSDRMQLSSRKDRMAIRKLERICPPTSDPIWNTNLDDDIVEEEILRNNRFSSYSLGDKSNYLLQRMRRKTLLYYEKLVDDLIMARCNTTLESPRCVERESEEALLNAAGSCRAFENTVCGSGTCEREANCYWNPIDAALGNRTTRYAPDLFLKAKESLIGLKQNSYLRSLLTITLIGTVVALVLLITWTFYFIGRFCCCCLWTSFSICYMCSPIPKEEGYLMCFHWIIPTLLYIFFTAVALLATFYSYMGVSAIGIALTKSLTYTMRLLDGIISTLERSRSTIVNMLNITDAAALHAQDLYDSTVDVNVTMTQISDSFETFQSLYSSSPTSFILDNSIGPIIQTIVTMISAVQENLYDGKNGTKLTLYSTINNMDAFNSMMTSWLNVISNFHATEFNLRIYVKLGLMALSLASVLISVFGLLALGLTCCKRRCEGCSRFLGFVGFIAACLGSLSLIVASIFLTFNVLWLDTCKGIDVISSDVRPFFGTRRAAIVNQIMNGHDIKGAFGLGSLFDYVSTWETNQQILYGSNVTNGFAKASEKMSIFQVNSIDTVTIHATELLNAISSKNTPSCPFNDDYTVENVFEPWTANQAKGQTSWPLFSTGFNGSYKRNGNESGLDYMGRIYNVAGSCNSTISCCLNQMCSLSVGHSCNSGSNCKYICSELYLDIIERYHDVTVALSVQQNMSADWGIVCPSNVMCPTDKYRDLTGMNQTISDLIQSYKPQVERASALLLNMTSGSMGELLLSIDDFLCDTNISFVPMYFSLAKNEVCGPMVAAFAQVNVCVWVVSIVLEVIAILSCILSIRMRGRSRKEKLFDTYDDLVTVVTAYKPPSNE